MNRMHRQLCSSDRWSTLVAARMPDDLDGLDLGDDVLEVGPGFGATTRALAPLVPRLTAVEIDQESVRTLHAEFGSRAEIVHGDGTALPFPDQRFSAVVCFTMLHHVPSVEQQNRLFAEAHRVLRPGGVFGGVDSLPSLRFRFLHLGDTMVLVDPLTLADRLGRTGFADVETRVQPRVRFRFQAHRPTW